MESKLRSVGVVVALLAFGCGGATDDGANPVGGNSENRSGPCPGMSGAPGGSDPVPVTVHVRNIISSAGPVAGARVKLCRKIDVTCELGEPPEGVVTDANGDATLMVAPGSTEYLEVIGAGELLPAEYFFNPLTFGMREVNVQLMTPSLRDSLAGVIGVAQQPERGIVLLSALNCQGTAAAKVAFSSDVSDAATKPFYVEGGLPNPALDATDTSGFGGFLNIQAGAVTITGTAAETSRVLDSISLLVKPNTLIHTSLLRGD